MSNKRKGQLTTDSEWRKHLRKIGKRFFWKGERLAEKKILNKEKEPYAHENVLHMWEDDYLMVEMLPIENLEFIKAETKRINNFGEENSEGIGFSEITVIGEKVMKTINKQIPIEQAKLFFRDSGLKKIEKVVMQNTGLLEGANTPLGYGSRSFAIILESESEYLKNIWLTGHIETESERQALKKGLVNFCNKFDFIGVDWYKAEYYNLNSEKQIAEYIKNSC